MPTAVLLNPDDPTFDFQHAMSHRAYMAIMAPLTRFSAMPYFVSDIPITGRRPATMWPLKHQQAHSDFANQLPPFYDARRVGFGLPYGQVLVNNDFSDPESRAWMTFANHREHQIADSSVLPLPTEVPPPLTPGGWFRGVNFPFW